VTLGVADIDAARRFYGALGWEPTPRGEGVVFFQAGCMVVAPWGRGASVLSVGYALRVVGAGAAVALTSNLINLMDLRPGRALKCYSVLAIAGALICAAGLADRQSAAPFSSATFVSAAELLVFALGPVIAVWRYDLREIGMLGDAGANPMGAVAGLLIVTGLPLWGLLGYLALVVALNLASERVSFSRVIESNAALSWLDELGRLHVGSQERIDG
jgi:hypothetical protein